LVQRQMSDTELLRKCRKLIQPSVRIAEDIKMLIIPCARSALNQRRTADSQTIVIDEIGRKDYTYE